MVSQVKSPFCQIEKREISGDHCQELHKASSSEDCFGCSSSYRQCVQCEQQPLAFPEVDLCAYCLREALSQERVEATLPRGAACEECRQRKIWYPQYKLCLHCTTEQYQPRLDSEAGTDDEPEGNGARRGRRNQRRGQSVDQLYDRALALVMQREYISIAALHRDLETSHPVAKKLMERLTENGVVGPAHGKRPREVLKRAEAQAKALAFVSPNGSTAVPALLDSPNSVEALLSLPSESRALLSAGLSLLVERLEETAAAAKSLRRQVQGK